MADLERKTFDFLAILTFLVVMLYVGAHVWAMTAGVIRFAEFVTNVGPMAGLLLGYWVRGQKGAA